MSLDVAARTDRLAQAVRYAARPADWPVVPQFQQASRWYHRMVAADDHEVWLLTWLPGQATELHDHGGSAGAFVVVSGELTEQTVTADRTALVSQTLTTGTGRQFGSHHVHRVANRGAQPAVSIHVYGPALHMMTRYRLGAEGLEVLAIDKAGTQW